jgi:hypothetical protein
MQECQQRSTPPPPPSPPPWNCPACLPEYRTCDSVLDSVPFLQLHNLHSAHPIATAHQQTVLRSRSQILTCMHVTGCAWLLHHLCYKWSVRPSSVAQQQGTLRPHATLQSGCCCPHTRQDRMQTTGPNAGGDIACQAPTMSATSSVVTRPRRLLAAAAATQLSAHTEGHCQHQACGFWTDQPAGATTRAACTNHCATLCAAPLHGAGAGSCVAECCGAATCA